MTKKILTALVLMAAIASCTPKRQIDDIPFKESLTFKDETLPCASFSIGGENATFILDTGSDISIISESFYKKHAVHFGNIRTERLSLSTINGTTDTNKTIVCDCMLNDSVLATFYVIEMSSTEANIFSTEGVLIDGLLGNDFFYLHNAVIDFGNKTIHNSFKTLE